MFLSEPTNQTIGLGIREELQPGYTPEFRKGGSKHHMQYSLNLNVTHIEFITIQFSFKANLSGVISCQANSVEFKL